MTPGLTAQIKPEWRQYYRALGTPTAGIVKDVSPSGNVAQIRLDPIADSYVLVSHLEPTEAIRPLPALVGPWPE